VTHKTNKTHFSPEKRGKKNFPTARTHLCVIKQLTNSLPAPPPPPPSNNAGLTRVVLHWGDKPGDLDTYVVPTRVTSLAGAAVSWKVLLDDGGIYICISICIYTCTCMHIYVFIEICMCIYSFTSTQIYQFTVKLTFEKFCCRVVKRHCGMIAAEFLTVSTLMNRHI